MTKAGNAKLNLYGDIHRPTRGNFGNDIAVQRLDDLDKTALERVKNMGRPARTLDVGSASGALAFCFALEADVEAFALDSQDYSQSFEEHRASYGAGSDCRFVQADIRGYDVVANLGMFDVVTCQRMIHYMRFDEAVQTMRRVKDCLNEDGRLFLSASGIDSELATGYVDRLRPVERRYWPLSHEMAMKHSIHGAVCLYSVADLALLIETAGMEVEMIYVSPFGNIKAIAA